ncbi:MAG: hypothetical protein KDA80_05215 [Planctomycetaceae bacterium]|nr:hypothetical protein [Planctomycetaceae bacterium]
MKTHYMLNIELTLIGPILTAGGETAAPGIDAPMARDRHGRWMLPFSLIKGKILDSLSELREAKFTYESNQRRYFPSDGKLNDWLGLPSKSGHYDPERGRLRFSDFHTSQSGNPDNVIDRIRLNRTTGSAQGRMLLMIQAPFGYGEEVTFEGCLEFVADETEAQEIRNLVDSALRWTPAFGAYRTVGFGRTKTVNTELVKAGARSQGTPAQGSLLPFELRLDRPLCLVGRKHSENHFESLECISGAVLKGAVAQMIQELTGSPGRDVRQGQAGFPHLRKSFDKLRFAEARARKSDATARPVEPPLSVVTCPNKKEGDLPYFDAALEEHPRLIRGAAPAFLPDWKDDDFGTVRTAFGWPLLPKERRTRTAINPVTGRAADKQLFSYGLVLPDRTTPQGTREEFIWDGQIGLESVDAAEHAGVRQELGDLLKHGIVGIGKTRAVASVTWISQQLPATVSSTPFSTQTVIITLQTECLMTNPATLQNQGDGDTLHTAYSEFWHDVSEGALELTRFFARQSVYGGFVSRRARNDRYEPFLLTDRGSVFVLTVADQAKSQTLLMQWSKQGLPNASWLTARYASDGSPLWQRCPYIQENGYGEVAIDLNCHTENRFLPEQQTTGAI